MKRISPPPSKASAPATRARQHPFDIPPPRAIMQRMKILGASQPRINKVKYARSRPVTRAPDIALLLLVSSSILCVSCSRISKENYTRIKNGMTLREVETLLGPGTETERQYVPTTSPTREPVVYGDRFYSWKDVQTGKEIFVGVKDGVVCDKWYWEPDL